MFQEYFKGKRVLVTGAGRGIGRALAKRLHSYEAKVVGVAKTEAHLKTLKEECPGLETIVVDLSDWDETRKALSGLPPFHYVVNNAGILLPGEFMDVKPEDFDKTMDVNVKSFINVGQIVAKQMIQHGIKGSIVNMSSDASSSAFPPCATYCLSKAAVDMLTKLMAVELGPKGIRVNAINPGGIYTDMLHDFYNIRNTYSGQRSMTC